MDVNKILNYLADKGRRYLTYVMALMGLVTIIGLFIPVTMKVMGIRVPLNENLFTIEKGKAIAILLFAIIFIVASQLKQFWGTPAVVLSIVIMILVGSITKGAGEVGAGVSFGGGLGVVRAARIFMLIAAILNTGLLVFKEFVLDKKAQ